MNTPQQQDYEALLRQVDLMVIQAEKRAHRTSVIIFTLALILAVYFAFAYYQIGQVDAEMAGNLVQGRLQESLPDAHREVVARLVAMAPGVMDRMQDAAFQTPERLKSWLLAMTIAQIRQEMSSMADELVPAMEEELDHLGAEFRDVAADKRGDAVAERIAQTFRDETIKAIDAAYAHYHERFNELVHYIEELAENESLNERQRHHRALLQGTVVMLERWNEHEPAPPEEPGVEAVVQELPNALPTLENDVE